MLVWLIAVVTGLAAPANGGFVDGSARNERTLLGFAPCLPPASSELLRRDHPTLRPPTLRHSPVFGTAGAGANWCETRVGANAVSGPGQHQFLSQPSLQALLCVWTT